MGKKNTPTVRTDDDTLVMEDEEIHVPRRYDIVLHNDDFTTQDFVVHILVTFLHKNQNDAHILMLKVHREGKARVGSYSKDIAETKVQLITAYSRHHGMPLLATLELAS